MPERSRAPQEGWTPLHWAAWDGRAEAVDALVAAEPLLTEANSRWVSGGGVTRDADREGLWCKRTQVAPARKPTQRFVPCCCFDAFRFRSLWCHLRCSFIMFRGG